MSRSCFFFHLLFIVEFFEELSIYAVKVAPVVTFCEASEDVVAKVALQLLLRNVAAVCLRSLIPDIFATQDLISVLIVPGALLRVRQTSVGRLYFLELFSGIRVSVFVRMPFQSSFFVRLNIKKSSR